MFFDIGGSMDSHIKTREELFSAARTERPRTSTFLLPQLPSMSACGRTTGAATRRRDVDLAGAGMTFPQ